MSRKEAFSSFTLNAFEKAMEGIFSTSITKDTIDECPMVYKPMSKIIEQIRETVIIDKVIKPIYNFKASESSGKR